MDQKTSAAAFAESLGQGQWGCDSKPLLTMSDVPRTIRDFLEFFEDWRECMLINEGRLPWVEIDGLQTAESKPHLNRHPMWHALNNAHPEWVVTDSKILESFIRPPELYFLPSTKADEDDIRRDELRRFVRFYNGDVDIWHASKRRFFCMLSEAAADARRSIAESFPSHGHLKRKGESRSKPVDKGVAAQPVTPRPARIVVRPEPRVPIRQLSPSPGLIAAEPLSFVLTSQVQATLHTRLAPAAIRAAMLTCLAEWLRSKHVYIPDDFASKSSWETGLEGSALQCWLETDSTRFALRLDEPCRQVLGRTWRTEIVLIDDQGKCAFAVRVSIMTQLGAAMQLPSVLPPWVPELGKQLTYVIDGLHQTGEPHRAVTRRETELLEKLIRDHKRQLPVVVMAADEGDGNPSACAARVAKELIGVAHVYVIASQGMTQLQNALGDAGYVPDLGVRLYGRAFESAAAAQHCPTLLPPQWPLDDSLSALKQACAAETVLHRDAHVELASYPQVRQAILRDRLGNNKTHNQSGKGGDYQAVIAERDELRSELKVSLEMADELSASCDRLREDLGNKDALLWIRDEQILKLRERLKQLETAQNSRPTLPTSWDDLADWAQAHHGSRVVITDGAQRAARESPFEDIQQVAKVIALLGDHYWSVMSSGDTAVRQKLNHALKNLNVTMSPVGGALNHHRFVDKYRTTWRGRSYLLDHHISGSSSRDRRHCLRLYFTWDKEHQVVIVGSYPEHKENTMT